MSHAFGCRKKPKTREEEKEMTEGNKRERERRE